MQEPVEEEKTKQVALALEEKRNFVNSMLQKSHESMIKGDKNFD